MDIFSHALWSNLEFRILPQTRQSPNLIGWGIFFSVLPDLFTFTYPFLWIVWHRYIKKDLKKWPRIPAEYENLPVADLTHRLYNYSHSIIVWTVVTAVVWIMMGSFPWVLLGWITHIIIDIPTHKKDFFMTPFLWPLSRFGIDGYAWDNRNFMALNVMSLIFLYILFFST